eukprot:1785133-Amphidinium_carterae.1
MDCTNVRMKSDWNMFLAREGTLWEYERLEALKWTVWVRIETLRQGVNEKTDVVPLYVSVGPFCKSTSGLETLAGISNLFNRSTFKD